MTSSKASELDEPKASEQLFQLALGYIPAISLNVVAKLSVADQLSEGPKKVEDIARVCKVNADILYRVMRAVASIGVFRELDHGRFEQTLMSDLLRANHPRSLRPFIVFFPDPLHFRCYASLMHAVKTGETTVKTALGQDIFAYLEDHPEESEIFNAAMVNITQQFIPAVLEAYDFGDTHVLADIGGGHGSVVAAILQKYPQMRGILFDMDHVVRGAPSHLQSAGVLNRCQVVPGDFFKSVPSGADTYIMKNIIHDWDDDACIAILKNVRKALDDRPNGKVLLLELVLTPGNEPHLGKWADIEMLALPGGRERTEGEYVDLFAKGGFRLNRVLPTNSPQSVLEAIAV